MTEIAALFALNPMRFSETVDNVGKLVTTSLGTIIATQKALLVATADVARQALDLNVSHARSLLQVETPSEALELQSPFAKTSFNAFRARAEKFAQISIESIEKTIKPMS